MMREDRQRSRRCEIVIADSGRMSELADESVHLVVTSPPYPMIEMWDPLFSNLDPMIRDYLSSDDQRDIMRAYSLMHDRIGETLNECRRALIDGGTCCINVGDAVRSVNGRFALYANHARMIETLEKLEFNILPYILWKKPTNKPNAFLGSGFLPPNAYVTIDCEYILIARKGAPRKFRSKDPMRYKSKFTKEERDRWFSQIWGDIPGTSQFDEAGMSRSGAFPLEIPRRLIRMFSIEGDVVLDPFMGTGTTLEAAMETGRSFIGYELDEGAISPRITEKYGNSVRVKKRTK